MDGLGDKATRVVGMRKEGFGVGVWDSEFRGGREGVNGGERWEGEGKDVGSRYRVTGEERGAKQEGK